MGLKPALRRRRRLVFPWWQIIDDLMEKKEKRWENIERKKEEKEAMLVDRRLGRTFTTHVSPVPGLAPSAPGDLDR